MFYVLVVINCNNSLIYSVDKISSHLSARTLIFPPTVLVPIKKIINE